MTDERGFTLVEMIVAMAVLGLMGFATVNLFKAQHQATQRQNAGVEATQNARAGLDMLVRELRNAGYDPRETSGATITTLKAEDIAWTADLNEDGDVDDFGATGDESVRYYFDSAAGTLVREADGVATPVVDGVNDFSLRYLDYQGNDTTDPTQVQQVDVSLEYDTPSGVMTGVLQTRVALRNLIYRQSQSDAVVCHNGTTKYVNPKALQSHLDHGDTEGPCP